MPTNVPLVDSRLPVGKSVLRVTVVAALIAMVLGRCISSALPGTRIGLERILDITWLLTAWWTQLLALLVVAVCTRFALVIAQRPQLAPGYRLIAVPAAATVIVLVIASAFDVLIEPSAPEMSLLLGVAGTTVAVVSATIALRHAQVRAAGLALVLVAAGSVAQVSARLLALQPGDGALPTHYGMARSAATAATLLDAGALTVAALWIAARMGRTGRSALLAVVALAAGIAVYERIGPWHKAGFFSVLLTRSLAQLHREPGSYLPTIVQNTQEILTLGLALLLLSRPSSQAPEQRLSLSMVLLARCSPDIPLCAGLLATGALGLGLMSCPPSAPAAS
jgi:hypothetical protein